ncbi:hypothetical protein EB796_011601 [Bugula neritina]|uniref:Uncharacterized protein n=1 Tax=Bugula neritina TaxID=10212 RepID=A0A7J7JXN4_BUGNE|nr:hypothetical protein EB796_011601 [Bugula neritina]
MAIPELGEDGRMKRTIKELINALPDEYQTLRWELNHRTPETVEATIDIIHQFSQLQPNTTTVRQVKNDSMVELEARLDQYMAQQNKMMQKLIETQGAMLEKLTLSTTSVQSRPLELCQRQLPAMLVEREGTMQGDVRNLGRETN